MPDTWPVALGTPLHLHRTRMYTVPHEPLPGPYLVDDERIEVTGDRISVESVSFVRVQRAQGGTTEAEHATGATLRPQFDVEGVFEAEVNP